MKTFKEFLMEVDVQSPVERGGIQSPVRSTVVVDDNAFNLLKQTSKHAGQVIPIPVTLKFRIAQQPEVIHTLEGVEHAPQGSYVMTGLADENYVINPDKFPKKYTNIKFSDAQKTQGFATKIVNSQPLDYLDPMQPFKAKVWAGVIQGNHNDILVRYGVNDYGIIKKQVNGKPLFTQLYKVIS